MTNGLMEAMTFHPLTTNYFWFQTLTHKDDLKKYWLFALNYIEYPFEFKFLNP